MSTSRKLIAILALFAFCASLPAYAGILNGHGAAFAGWTGSVPFNNGLGLSGSIDYAVFPSSGFNANFSGLGYVPTDLVVYTYQLNITGSAGGSTEVVGVMNPASGIGTFDIGDVDASSAFFAPNATWLFSPEIATGESSWGLAFSSPNLPIPGAALTVDNGTSAFVTGIPTPGPDPIPEPASLLLLASGVAVSCFCRRSVR